MLSIPVTALICPSWDGKRSARVFIIENDNDFQFHRQAEVASLLYKNSSKRREQEETPYRRAQKICYCNTVSRNDKNQRNFRRYRKVCYATKGAKGNDRPAARTRRPGRCPDRRARP